MNDEEINLEQKLELKLSNEIKNMEFSLNNHLNLKFVNGMKKTCIDLCQIDLYSKELPKQKIKEFDICIKKFINLLKMSNEEYIDTINYQISSNI